MIRIVKKFASIVMSFLMVLSVIVLPENGFSVSALTEDSTTYYTERGTTERFTSATADDFNSTAADLVAAGYTEYSQNAIAMNGKSNTAGADNLYAVYLNSDKTELKHIAFHTNTKALHITTQSLNANDALALSAATEYTSICDPLFIQIIPDETVVSGGTSGMSYALRMRDGRFIMIDSGMEVGDNTYQADNIYNVLEDNNVLDEITIAAWVFTHAHSDHITAFTSLVNKYYNNVSIEQLIYNYPCDDDILKDPDMAADQALSEGGIVYEQRKAIAEKLPNVKISTPYAGDLYKFPGVELEFYLTPTDMFPVMCYQGNEFNTSSLIFKIKAEGQEILITGDSADYALVNVAMPRFGTSLGSDMVQMVHHGITFASGEFYELVGAETAFWPIISGRVSTIVKQKQNMGLINAPSTKEIILSSLGTRTITLPYTPAERDGLFVTPDGEVVDSTIYEKPVVQKYGDILDEDNTPWARSENNYPLNNGGKYITWGSIKHNTSVTNGSDTSIYFNTNATTVYTPVNALKPNTLYTLSFDYMASSTTAPSNGMFSKFGISGVNSDSPTFSYNIYQGKSKTVNPNEVYGTDNGWNHIEVSFTTDSTIYDEYYLSFLATVGSVSGSYKGYIDNISLAETPKTYQYVECDYENLSDTEEWFAKSGNFTAALETENPISGSASLKLTGSSVAYGGISILPFGTTLKSGRYYRVKADTKVLSGTFDFGRIGNIGFDEAGKFNWTHIHIQAGYTGSSDNGGIPLDLWKWTNRTPSSATLSKKGTVKISENAQYQHLGVAYHISALDTATSSASIMIDNIVAAEIIDVVTATPSDSTMGTAEVTNADTAFTDFAVNETAIFSATPANGSYFVGWYDEEGALVSLNETYKTVVTTDTKLTAKFESVENLIQVSFNSNGGTDVETISGGADAKMNMPATPTKDGFTFAGWYLDKDCTVKYPCKVFPKEDTTLYAKWINGVYQDFESFTVSTNNPTKSEVAEDFANSYSGTYAYKATGDAKTVCRVVVPQTASGKLSAFANPGDKITISFKYKLVSGSMAFYPHTATTMSNASALASYTTASGSTGYANGYDYYSTKFTTVSDEWQTFTHTYTLRSQSYFDSIGVDAEKALGYTLLYLTAQSTGTEFYVDDVMIYKTIDIPINYSNEAVRLEPVNAAKPLTAAIQGDTVEFKALCDASVTPTIKYGENVLNSVDGVYSITVTADDALTVTTEGVTAAQNHAPGVGLNGENLTKYDADVFMNKIWEGDTVYHEAVMFVNSVDGTVQTTKQLLYPIDDIISIRNQNLNKWYVKGVDFKVEDGKLVWIDGGKCPIYTLPLVVPTDENDPFYDPALNYGGFNSASAYYTLEEGGDLGLKLMGDAHHEDYTVYVTYKHSKTWDDLGEEGYTPKAPDNQSYDMQKFYNKLATNEDVNVLVYGASTATGCGATGRNLNYELFGKTPDENGDYEVTLRNEKGTGISAPTFFEQATAELVKQYGNGNNINYYNISCGGTGAKWGAENLQSRVAFMNKYYGETIVPDIIYIKFAGNDVRTTPESLVSSYTSMISQFRELYPDATIVMISGKINNERCYIFGDNRQNVLNQEKALTELADATPNCIIAKTTSVWAEIVESKDCEDYLSNNINHANDFWAKTTASIIVASAEKKENVSAVKTAYNNSAALRSGEASTTGKNGLRIYNEIKNEWITAANIVEYGSIAAFALNAEGEITLQNGKKGIAFSDGTFSAEKYLPWETKDGSVVFTSYLTNISDARYDDDILVRSYAIAADGTVYYGETVTISVFAVANAVDNGNTADGSESSEADKNAFYCFVTDTNAAEYKSWCTEKAKTIGSLFTTKYGV